MDEATCSRVGCNETAIACYLMDPGPKSVAVSSELLCVDHAAEAGYCTCCGWFSAGTDAFDFRHPGLCETCYDELDAESDDEHDDVEDYDWPEE